MPVLHLLVGPNGAGKTTLFEHVIEPATRLPFINADRIAHALWPGDEETHGHEAALQAEARRAEAIAAGRSFVAETVFSHPAKVDLVRSAQAAGYLVTLHVVLVPEELAVARAKLRAADGGHSVPEHKVRARYHRLWINVRAALALADETFVYDNSRARTPFRPVGHLRRGVPDRPIRWPAWSPLDGP